MKKKEKVKPLGTVRSESHAKAKIVQTARSLREALEQIDELEMQVDAIKQIQSAPPSTIIIPRHKGGESEAVAVAVATDWHLGELIRPEQVSGLNTFNIAIATKRIATFFERVVKLAEKERQDVKLDELVLFLGGDLIDGALHMDTIMTNEIAEPMHQVVLCQQLIESGLNFLSNHGKFKRITVVCADGNHGRITQKLHSSSRQGNALEYYMYYNLAARFPNLNWVIADGLHVYFQVFDHILRFHHGDTIGFGGVNGPYTYLNRRIYQWDQAHRATYSIQGHLHCWTLGARRWLINGSLVGYSPYALTFGGEFQPPIQAFFLVDKKRGITVQIPILV